MEIYVLNHSVESENQVWAEMECVGVYVIESNAIKRMQADWDKTISDCKSVGNILDLDCTYCDVKNGTANVRGKDDYYQESWSVAKEKVI